MEDGRLTRRDLLAAGAVAMVAIEGRRRRPRRAREPRSLARERARLLARDRPIVFNSDADVLHQPGSGTARGLLANRFTALEGTQVASVGDCTGGTILMTHDTRAGERFDDLAGDPQREALSATAPIAAAWIANMRSLRAGGGDRLRVVGDWARRRDIEHLWSFRVNDVHDAILPWSLSRWKRAHPGATLARPGDSADPDDPRYWWTALDFDQARVRDLLVAIVADTLRRYPLDGVELDYMRAPLFFRPHLDLAPATERQVGLMTSLQRRFRALAYAEGIRRRRPLLVAARVPATLERCRHCGIDLERWLGEGLVDVLRVSGGYFPFTEPVRDAVRLGHRHGVPVHPTISASGLPGRYATVEAWRGAAAVALRSGADGVHTFNFFPKAGDPRLREIGTPASLRGPLLFAVEPERIEQGLTRNAIDQDAALPFRVPGGRRLPIAVKVRAGSGAVLRVRIGDPSQADGVGVRLNGALLADAQRTDGGWLVYAPDPRRFRLGGNAVEVVALNPSVDTTVTALEVELRDR
jgi:hypothetical protein